MTTDVTRRGFLLGSAAAVVAAASSPVVEVLEPAAAELLEQYFGEFVPNQWVDLTWGFGGFRQVYSRTMAEILCEHIAADEYFLPPLKGEIGTFEGMRFIEDQK